jgi:hypothetical protein
VRITQWDPRDTPVVMIEGADWSIHLAKYHTDTRVHMNIRWEGFSVNLKIAYQMGFARVYEPIKDECQKVMSRMESMQVDFTRECVMMWLRCAARLGVVQDIRMVIGRMLYVMLRC